MKNRRKLGISAPTVIKNIRVVILGKDGVGKSGKNKERTAAICSPQIIGHQISYRLHQTLNKSGNKIFFLGKKGKI